MASRFLRAQALLSIASGVLGAVTMPQIFSDGMVLQDHATYDQRPFVYGQADVGEIVNVNRTLPGQVPEVRIVCGAARWCIQQLLLPCMQPYFATADGTGLWIVELDPDYFAPSNNGLIVVTVAGSADGFQAVTTIRNVSYGDVFLCSGQVRKSLPSGA